MTRLLLVCLFVGMLLPISAVRAEEQMHVYQVEVIRPGMPLCSSQEGVSAYARYEISGRLHPWPSECRSAPRRYGPWLAEYRIIGELWTSMFVIRIKEIRDGEHTFYTLAGSIDLTRRML